MNAADYFVSRNMNFQAVLFDMDGVIVDTRHSVIAFWEALASVHQMTLTPADFDQHIYGCPATDTLDTLFPKLSNRERRAVLTGLASYEASLSYTEVPGATELLHALKRHYIPTALVTSAEQRKVTEVLRQLGINGMFTVQVTADDIQHGKPDPECYLQAARALQQPPAACIVFEDAINGVKAAVAAGTLCIGVQSLDTAAALLQVGAHGVVPDFTPVRLLAPATNEPPAGISLRLGSGTGLSGISLWTGLTG
jgi:sugar-phosphatase